MDDKYAIKNSLTEAIATNELDKVKEAVHYVKRMWPEIDVDLRLELYAISRNHINCCRDVQSLCNRLKDAIKNSIFLDALLLNNADIDSFSLFIDTDGWTISLEEPIYHTITGNGDIYGVDWSPSIADVSTTASTTEDMARLFTEARTYQAGETITYNGSTYRVSADGRSIEFYT